MKLITALSASMLAALSNAAPATSKDTSPAMLGWDTFNNFALSSLRPGEVERQFASYDREDKNDDGFEGTYSCLRIADDGRCVIAEYDDTAGEISSIWFTYDVDSVEKIGDIQIVLDGKTVLSDNLQKVVNSEIGAPFVWPLVGNTDDTSGGNVIKVPMPFSKSMYVTTQNNPHFYHVTYRTFEDGTNVETFDPTNTADEIRDRFAHFGVQDPKPQAATLGCNECKSSDSQVQKYSVSQGGSANAVELSEGGVITNLKLRVNEILAGSHVEDDGRAFGDKGSSSFTMTLDSANAQCKLTRRFDQTIGHQSASISIDGNDAGEWEDSGAGVNATWADQVVELDSALTQGKTSITIKNVFASSDNDFNEFHYSLHCKTDGDWDNHAYGVNDNEWTLMDLLNVGPNNQHDEAAHDYEIVGQTWGNVRWFKYGGERGEKADDNAKLLDGVSLKITFDGHETVNVPIGSFFGSSLSKFQVRSEMLSVDDLTENGAFTSWWPMPFSKSAKIGLASANGDISGTVAVDYRTDCNAQCTLTGSNAKQGYFSTDHKHAETVTGELWDFYSDTGRGVVYGVSHAFRGAILPPDNGKEFLEGDLKVWVNNKGKQGKFADADMLGTGTEDYYESGWYFKDNNYSDDEAGEGVPFAMPMTGLTGHVEGEVGVKGQGLHAYRLMLSDSIAFDDGIAFTTEHGPVDNNINADYETCAYYYKPL